MAPMKHILAFGIVALTSVLAQPPALAAEGRVSELQEAPLDPQRVSKYTGTRGAAPAVAQKSSKQHKLRPASKTAALKSVRPSTTLSARASDFWFHDAGSTLRSDRDGDGFSSRVPHPLRRRRHLRQRDRVRAAVSASRRRSRLAAVSRDGRLRDHRRGRRRRLLRDHDARRRLADRRLRRADRPVRVGLPRHRRDHRPGRQRQRCAAAAGGNRPRPADRAARLSYQRRDTTLLIDDDDDGHYSKFRIDFDPDADFDGTFVYAEVWVRAQGGEWIQEHVSDDFLVDASGDDDVYSLTADWISGYPTAFYDVQIDLRDADTERWSLRQAASATSCRASRWKTRPAIRASTRSRRTAVAATAARGSAAAAQSAAGSRWRC